MDNNASRAQRLVSRNSIQQQGHLPLDPHAALAQDRFLLGQDAQLDPTLRSLIHAVRDY